MTPWLTLTLLMVTQDPRPAPEPSVAQPILPSEAPAQEPFVGDHQAPQPQQTHPEIPAARPFTSDAQAQQLYPDGPEAQANDDGYDDRPDDGYPDDAYDDGYDDAYDDAYPESSAMRRPRTLPSPVTSGAATCSAVGLSYFLLAWLVPAVVALIPYAGWVLGPLLALLMPPAAGVAGGLAALVVAKAMGVEEPPLVPMLGMTVSAGVAWSVGQVVNAALLVGAFVASSTVYVFVALSVSENDSAVSSVIAVYYLFLLSIVATSAVVGVVGAMAVMVAGSVGPSLLVARAAKLQAEQTRADRKRHQRRVRTRRHR